MISRMTLVGGLAAVALGLGSIACGGVDDAGAAAGTTDEAVVKAEAISSTSLAKICNQKTLALSSCKTISSRASAALSASQKKKLEGLISQSTDSWGDSIYEGDVDGNEDHLEYVATALTKKSNGALLGYKVRFSFLGWETSCSSNANYDRAKPETLTGCEMGRIYQTLLVQTDLKDYEVLADAELILDRK
jgi:hypothetical protein